MYFKLINSIVYKELDVSDIIDTLTKGELVGYLNN